MDGAKLQYLQFGTNGDTAILHLSIDIWGLIDGILKY